VSSIQLGRIDGAATFTLSFAPSVRHALEVHLHCVYAVKAIQSQPRVIEILFAAGTSPNRQVLSTAGIPLRKLVHDIHDGDGRELCLGELYDAFATAVEEGLTDSSLAGDSTIDWLPQKGA
jgi:hypothetical protein